MEGSLRLYVLSNRDSQSFAQESAVLSSLNLSVVAPFYVCVKFHKLYCLDGVKLVGTHFAKSD